MKWGCEKWDWLDELWDKNRRQLLVGASDFDFFEVVFALQGKWLEELGNSMEIVTLKLKTKIVLAGKNVRVWKIRPAQKGL